jgi:hypothetical protein
MLSDPGRGQEDPLSLPFRPHGGAVLLADLVAQGRLEHRDVEFILAEQSELAAVLQAQEVGQLSRDDAFGAGGVQQHPVEAAGVLLAQIIEPASKLDILVRPADVIIAAFG